MSGLRIRRLEVRSFDEHDKPVEVSRVVASILSQESVYGHRNW